MNVAETLRGLWRRWYIVVPGLVLAVVLAVGSFVMIKPGYERTATQLLLPGEGLVPEGASNPYLFLGGLTQAADILVRTMGAEETLEPIIGDATGVEVQVSRDPSSSGPVILFTVTAPSDADAAEILDGVLSASVATLTRLQDDQDVRQSDRISISELTKDVSSTPQQRTRMITAIGIGAGMVVLTLLLASLIDGLARKRRVTKGSLAADQISGGVNDDSQDDLDVGDLTDEHLIAPVLAAPAGRSWDSMDSPPTGSVGAARDSE